MGSPVMCQPDGWGERRLLHHDCPVDPRSLESPGGRGSDYPLRIESKE